MPNDPFVDSVVEILSKEKSKYFFEWLAQTRFALSSKLSGETKRSKMLQTSGAILLCDEIMQAINSASAEAGITTTLEIDVNGVLARVPLVSKKISVSRKRGTASSEPQPKNLK